jgi:hypothetical protein
LAIQLGDPVSGEDLAGIGSRYFPEDPQLQWYLGVSRLQQGRAPEGEAAVRESIRLAPGSVGPRATLVRHLLVGGRMIEARATIAAMVTVRSDEEDEAAEALLQVGRVLGRTMPTVALGLGGAAVGLALVPAVGPLVLPLSLVGVAIAAAGWMQARWVVGSWVSQSHLEDVSEAVKRVQRRMRNDPRIS